MSQHTSGAAHEEPKKPVTDEINDQDLEKVSGGINPQPLPPHHPPSDD
jgi:hypothetical protein